MQISSQEIEIFPQKEVMDLSSCEEKKIQFIEVGIVLLLVPIVKHMETTTL